MDTQKGGQGQQWNYQQNICWIQAAWTALGKHVVNLYSTGISWVGKITDVKKLQQDIENDPIIKDQMADLDCLLVCVFGNFLPPVLVALHRVNNLDLGDELENEATAEIWTMRVIMLLHLPCQSQWTF